MSYKNFNVLIFKDSGSGRKGKIARVKSFRNENENFGH